MLRRTPLKRGKPLKQSGGLKRSRINPVNRKRRAAKYIRNFAGPNQHDTWIRALPCCLCKHLGQRQGSQTQSAHTVARGMGGAKGTYRDTVPLCNAHHRVQETVGNERIMAHYGLDLVALAAALAAQHERESGNALEI
jgi:hypothetical protein